MRNEGVAEIAKRLGCSRAYVSMVMSGKKKPSRRIAQELEKLTKLTKYLDRSTIARASVSSYNSTGLHESGAAEWCSGSTGEFGSLSPGSIPGSAARL